LTSRSGARYSRLLGTRGAVLQEAARTAEEASGKVLVGGHGGARALQTLVRRFVDALDAAWGTESERPRGVRELLREIEAMPWGALVEEAEQSRAARREEA